MEANARHRRIDHLDCASATTIATDGSDVKVRVRTAKPLRSISAHRSCLENAQL
jgi:hypothetical protein